MASTMKNNTKIMGLPLLRFRIINQATRAALISSRPSPAKAMPTMTNLGNSDFSISSMEAGSGSAMLRGKIIKNSDNKGKRS